MVHWRSLGCNSATLQIFTRLNLHILLYVDGMDECDDHFSCAESIRSLLKVEKVKICVSSRPEQTLLDELIAPNINLEQHNFNDIETFVQTKFMDNRSVQAFANRTGSMAHIGKITESISYKAEGVFLWAHLVVKDLLDGVSTRDNLAALEARLETLPSDMLKLYNCILSRHSSRTDFQKGEAALYFRLVLHRTSAHSPWILSKFILAVDDDLRSRCVKALSVGRSEQSLITQDEIDTWKVWINTRTAGLLLLNRLPNYYTEAPCRMLNTHVSHESSLDFIHHSAIDFIRGEDGQHLLRAGFDPGVSFTDRIYDAHLVYYIVLTYLRNETIDSEHFDHVLYSLTEEQALLHTESQDAKEIWRCLSLSNRLAQDEQWRRFDCDLRSSGRRRIVMPSSSFAKIDMVPCLIMYRRYRQAASLIETYKAWELDTNYVARLLQLMVQVDWYQSGQQEQDAFNFTQKLVNAGGNLLHTLVDSIGEPSVPILGALPGTPVLFEPPKEHYLLRSLGAMNTDAVSVCRIDTRCQNCHNVWFGRNPRLKEIFVWGNFGLQSVLEFLRLESAVAHSATERPIRNCIKVLVLCSEFVEMWKITDEASNEFWQKCMQPPTPVSWSGDHMAFYSHLELDNMFEIKDRHRFPRLYSFADAMKWMGKSEATILSFYRHEAARMVIEYEHVREGWVEWYWGAEGPPISRPRPPLPTKPSRLRAIKRTPIRSNASSPGENNEH